MRKLALLAVLLLGVAFFLPAATETSGVEAFRLSLSSWAEPGSWDLESLPLVFSWLANVGALCAFVVVLGGVRRRWLEWLSALTLLALGPLLVVARELRIGYYVWTGACLLAAALVVVGARRGKGDAA